MLNSASSGDLADSRIPNHASSAAKSMAAGIAKAGTQAAGRVTIRFIEGVKATARGSSHTVDRATLLLKKTIQTTGWGVARSLDLLAPIAAAGARHTAKSLGTVVSPLRNAAFLSADGMARVGSTAYRVARSGVGASGRFAARWLEFLGRVSLFGVCALGRGLRRAFLKPMFISPWRKLLLEIPRIKEGFSIARNRLSAAASRHALAVIPEFGRVTGKGLFRHRRLILSAFNHAMPLAGIAAVAMVLNFWGGVTIALSVEYDGQHLGYVSQEAMFDTAVDSVQSLVISEGDSFQLSHTPRYTLALIPANQVSDTQALATKILESSTSESLICEASGLYVNGEMVGVMQSTADVQEVLDQYMSAFTSDPEAEQAAFSEGIQIRAGLYPASEVKDSAALREGLEQKIEKSFPYVVAEGDSIESIAEKFGTTAADLEQRNPSLADQLWAGNEIKMLVMLPRLSAQVTRTESITQDVDFDSETIENDKELKSYQKVIQAGEKGQEQFDYQVIYVNGIEQSRSLINTIMLKDPVNEKIEVGTKEPEPASSKAQKNSSSSSSSKSSSGSSSSSSSKIQSTPSGDAVASGNFLWPVNGGRTSSNYGYRGGKMHKGLDIAAPSGTSILAADGGVVEHAGWMAGGAGYAVVINHGNGFKTCYYHCSAVYAAVGQKVSRGAVIAAVGRTGYATGNHLHFEVIKNGANVNPAAYL